MTEHEACRVWGIFKAQEVFFQGDFDMLQPLQCVSQPGTVVFSGTMLMSGAVSKLLGIRMGKKLQISGYKI